MSEMVDRVAQACHDARIFVTISDMPAPYNETSPNNRYLYLKLARAAIVVLREPTEAMLNACLASMGDEYNPEVQKRHFKHAWQAAIDAALED
jgi:hypothetical protein